MTPALLYGRPIADRWLALCATFVAQRFGEAPPCLAILLVGEEGASARYVRHKEVACGKVGIQTRLIRLPADTPPALILEVIASLNDDPQIDAILLQLPLPPHWPRAPLFLKTVAAEKDVDGLHPLNMGHLFQGSSGLRPCTSTAIMRLLRGYDIALAGRSALVVGRSLLVGRPVALELLSAGCTVTIAHRQTADLHERVRQADLLIVAIGAAEFIQSEWIKPGAVVVDVGINTTPGGGVIGDVAREARAASAASWISPVPQGVGPMTVAALLSNVCVAYARRWGVTSRLEALLDEKIDQD